MAEGTVSDAWAIVTRKEARTAGLKRYFTGKACSKGHFAERLVDGGNCAECSAFTSKRWKENNREHTKQYSRRYYKENPAVVRANETRRLARKRACTKKRREIEALKRTPETQRQCIACQAIKPLEDFHKDQGKRLGVANRCKACAKQKALEWYYSHPLQAKQSRARNHSLRRNAEGSFSESDVSRIFSLQKGKCAVCAARLDKSWHLDHIVPVSKGGTNAPRNLQICCRGCNLSKGARDPVTFMQALGRLL